jgi:hypothetical protein
VGGIPSSRISIAIRALRPCPRARLPAPNLTSTFSSLQTPRLASSGQSSEGFAKIARLPSAEGQQEWRKIHLNGSGGRPGQGHGLSGNNFHCSAAALSTAQKKTLCPWYGVVDPSKQATIRFWYVLCRCSVCQQVIDAIHSSRL